MATKTNVIGSPCPDSPCVVCGIEGFVYDDGHHMHCTDCGAAWLTESYVPRMAEKLGEVDREPTYMEKVRAVVEGAPTVKHEDV